MILQTSTGHSWPHAYYTPPVLGRYLGHTHKSMVSLACKAAPVLGLSTAASCKQQRKLARATHTEDLQNHLRALLISAASRLSSRDAHDSLTPGTCETGGDATACSAPGSCNTWLSAPAQAPATLVSGGCRRGHAWPGACPKLGQKPWPELMLRGQPLAPVCQSSAQPR